MLNSFLLKNKTENGEGRLYVRAWKLLLNQIPDPHSRRKASGHARDSLLSYMQRPFLQICPSIFDPRREKPLALMERRTCVRPINISSIRSNGGAAKSFEAHLVRRKVPESARTARARAPHPRRRTSAFFVQRRRGQQAWRRGSRAFQLPFRLFQPQRGSRIGAPWQ